METIVYQIEFKDGRTFRVFCANRTQKNTVIQSYNQIKDRVKEIKTITTGLHTVSQYMKIISEGWPLLHVKPKIMKEPDFSNIDQIQFKILKALYEQALKDKKNSFLFQRTEVKTDEAKYLVEYLGNKFRR